MKRTIFVALLVVFAVMIFTQPAMAACSDLPAPGVDWSGCDKNGENLTGEDLSGANLIDTSFIFAQLDNANLSGANMSNADVQLANLENANLSNTTNTGNYTQATLTNADLTDAHFENANLFEARGLPLNHQLATFVNVTCPSGSNSATNGSSPQNCWAPNAVTLTSIAAQPAANAGSPAILAGLAGMLVIGAARLGSKVISSGN